MHQRPTTLDYPPYYGKYVEKISETDGITALSNALKTTLVFLKNIPKDRWNYSYAPKKWMLKESWIHVIDAERVFAYRALRIGRGDETPLAGFDQDDYVPHSNAANRTPASIIEEYQMVRQASLHLFRNFPNDAWTRRGTASGGTVNVNALAFIIAGHETHHVQLTKERYL